MLTTQLIILATMGKAINENLFHLFNNYTY
jgi:hypothetical protein